MHILGHLPEKGTARVSNVLPAEKRKDGCVRTVFAP
jgi:hypothetical protein